MKGITVPHDIAVAAVGGEVAPLIEHIRVALGESVSDSDIDVVWGCWLDTFGHLHKKRTPKLTQKKRKIIRSRLRMFTAQELCDVIKYVITDDFWMGKNDRSTAYYFIDNIFLNDDRVEKLLLKVDDASEDISLIEELKRNIRLLSHKAKVDALDLKEKNTYVKLIKRTEELSGQSYDYRNHRWIDA